MREERTTGVDCSRAIPTCYQVGEHVEAMITEGEIHPNERMFSEAVIADPFGVSRSTVNEAIAILPARSKRHP